MPRKLGDFLLGLAIPPGLSAIWFGAMRWFVAPATMMRLYTTFPTKGLVPAALVGLTIVIVLISWRSRRYTAYGALAALVPAVVATLALLLGTRPGEPAVTLVYR